MRATALGPDQLGEGLCWEGGSEALWRVDILAGLVHRSHRPLRARPSEQTTAFDGEVGFALPRRGGGMVVGVEQDLILVEPDGSRRRLLQLDEAPAIRFNDAACDAQGRLWAGTFARDRREGSAALYRVDPDGAIECVLEGLTISNGLGWLSGGNVLHHVDSPTQRLVAFDVDVERGRIGAPRIVAAFEPADGMPDGLCIDSQDGTWVALFGGSEIVRLGPEGNITARLSLPVPHVTNVCLGGSDGRDLFISTTRHRLAPAQLAGLPSAGYVFHDRADVGADPALPFAG